MRIVIVGGGKKVDFLIGSLLNKKDEITVINDNEQDCEKLASHHDDILIIYGNASKKFILEDAEIKDADLIIVLTHSDADNYVICSMAKKVFGVKEAFATVTNPHNVQTFKALGINRVLSATYIVSEIIEEMAEIHDIVNLMPLEDDKLRLIVVGINENHHVHDKKLGEIKLPENSVVGCIIRNGKVIIPNSESKIFANDKLAILAESEIYEKAINSLIGGN